MLNTIFGITRLFPRTKRSSINQGVDSKLLRRPWCTMPSLLSCTEWLCAPTVLPPLHPTCFVRKKCYCFFANKSKKTLSMPLSIFFYFFDKFKNLVQLEKFKIFLMILQKKTFAIYCPNLCLSWEYLAVIKFDLGKIPTFANKSYKKSHCVFFFYN